MRTFPGCALGVACLALACAGVAHADGWNDYYVGATAGYGAGQVRLSIPHAPSATADLSGEVAGLNVGKDWRVGHFVYGLEGAASYGALQGSRELPITVGYIGPAPIIVNAEVKTQLNFIGDLRGRVGYAAGPWLLYAATGPSWGLGKGTTPAGSATSASFGWSGGLGVERTLVHGLSARLEADYTDFSKVTRSGASDQLNTERVGLSLIKRF
jgi:opacity protein-like surface antigen